MTLLLMDTCVVLDLAKEPEQRPLLNVLFELESDKTLRLLVPRIVLDEFHRNKERIVEQNTRGVSSVLKRAKEVVGKFGDEATRQVALEQINAVDQKLPRLGDAVLNTISNITRLLERGEIVETSDAMKLRAAQRALERKAPFHRQKNSFHDALIIEALAEARKGRKRDRAIVFVTHNIHDFSDPSGNAKLPHPDFAPLFATPQVRYFITLAEALNAIQPGAVEEFAFDMEPQPRRTDEILAAHDLLWHQIWFNRHQCMRERFDAGKEVITPEILQMAIEAAARVEKKYGVENLGPWDDFEWGMLNGKLSALNWVLGDEWDMLDT